LPLHPYYRCTLNIGDVLVFVNPRLDGAKPEMRVFKILVKQHLGQFI
jgi:hypothetical protein